MCPSDQACINKQCKDPCAIGGQCGSCSECSVVNHGVQCSCPDNFNGDPFKGCVIAPQRCNSYCKCDESGVFCAEDCKTTSDCACGQICNRGKCRSKCNPGNCPAGQLCKNGACVAGCRTNADCSNDRSCINGQCLDPCKRDKPCGENAICQVADHRALCLCKDGFQGEPTKKCTKFECQTNEDCTEENKCVEGFCRNPCFEPGACGINAQCRVVGRRAQCSCTPNFVGNPEVECRQFVPGICLENPCGDNADCKEQPDRINGFECMCKQGCVGDPRKGCICSMGSGNACNLTSCGVNAKCRVNYQDIPECYCPEQYPYGKPYEICKLFNFQYKNNFFF